MKRAVLLSVLAILLSVTSALSVNAQEPTPTEAPVEIPTEVPTVDPNSCYVNFLTTTRQGVSARYYLYLSKWLAFSLSGATGQVTLNSENYGFTLYRGKADFAAKTFAVKAVDHIDANTNFAFMVDTLNSPQMIVVFDCISDVNAFNADVTTGTFSDSVDTSCTVLNRPRINSVTLPSVYTFGNVYILPIFNTAGSLALTSTLQSFSTATSLNVDSTVGKWFENVDSGVARGIEAGWTGYANDPTVTVTSFVTSATVDAGSASLTVVGCN